MNAMIMSALAAVGIAGFFSATQSDPKNAKDGCCSKPAEDHCGKEKKPDPCCETQTAPCCEKKDDFQHSQRRGARRTQQWPASWNVGCKIS